MNAIVCAKQVPSTDIKIEVKDGRVNEASLESYVMNPYDEYALEEALLLKERFEEGKVTLVTLGPERVRETILTGLAMGADEAIHIKGEEFAELDGYTTAKVLAEAIKKLDYDIILCGKQGVDDDNAQVGIALAELLGLPHVSVVTKLEVSDDKNRAIAQREVEGGKEVVETPLPAVITAQKGLNEPRYPSLRGIMTAKKKPLQRWGPSDLGLDPTELEAKVRVVEVSPPPERQAGRIVEGEPAEAARKLVHLLREEAKII